MKVFIKGKGEIELKSQDFLASGGEASVYKKGNHAYKIYTDINKMIPVSKIQELAVLTHPNIIKPEDILLNSKNQLIGYNMKLVPKYYSLCQLFPKSFRQRENLDHKTVFKLVEKMQNIMHHCHEKNIIIADFNEMNLLVSDSFDDVYLIDVDSVKTPSFPPTALMESIRDRHNPNIFNEGTDWFAFAIISFMTIIGIHPYKGKHPSIKDMDTRMMKNISVLHKDVSIPPVCYDIKIIPSNYMKWFDAIFEQGKRVAPPFGTEFVQLVATRIKTIVGNNKFDIQELKDCLEDIYNYFSFPGVELVITEKSILFNSKKLDKVDCKAVGITAKRSNIVFAKSENGKLSLYNVTAQKKIDSNMDSDAVMAYNGTIYNKIGSNIVEVNFMETGNDIVPVSKVVCQTMENATSFFDGVVVQNMLGSQYVTVFPKPGMAYQINIKELKNYAKIIDAKYDSKVMILAAIDAKGKTDELIFRFDDKFETYDLRKRENITFSGLNFVVLDTGVCVTITSTEQFELFSSSIGSAGLKVIDDPAITSDMKLYKDGVQVVFAHGSKLYKLKLK